MTAFRMLLSSGALAALALRGEPVQPSPTYTPYRFSTLAGAAPSGSLDGVRGAARFNGPAAVVVGSRGNLVVADTWNSAIRTLSTNGMVTTLAGTPGKTGSADGPANTASFYYPLGVAMDSVGNIYVADSGNATLRKITAGGQVMTLAGLAGHFGSTDGNGSEARFDSPSGVAVNADGNVYVVDSGNSTIRKMTPGGNVTTIAGLAGTLGSADGMGSDARFYFPTSLALDSAGDLYVADLGNSVIRKVTLDGVVTALTELSVGSAASVPAPAGVAVDQTGNIYTIDTLNSFVQRRNTLGQVNQLTGLAGVQGSADGSADNAEFNYASGITIDSTGFIYVADFGNNTIRKVSRNGLVSTLAGVSRNSPGADGVGAAARFNSPRTVAVNSDGVIYVADSFSETIRKVTPDGVVSTLAGSIGRAGSVDGIGSQARFRYPSGVALDKIGNLYVADLDNATLRKITPSGAVTTVAGVAGIPGSQDGTASEARFRYPSGLSVDSDGNIYVADQGNKTIRKVTPQGNVTTLAGAVGHSGSADGVGSAARFGQPYDVAVDGQGSFYVADAGNHTIRKVTAAGTVTTLPGKFGTNCVGALLGVAVDNADNVYVADACGAMIWRITPAGSITALAGRASAFYDEPVGGSADGAGADAGFLQPRGVAVDAAGNVYVADSGNNTIRKGTPESPADSGN